jgi:TonB family protein
VRQESHQGRNEAPANLAGWAGMRVDNMRFWGETPLQKKSFNLSLVDMPERAIPGAASSTLQGRSAGTESDIGELAALFTAHGGGNFSVEVAADLALEIVLNEIVEQACLATGATGAAIILERDGEMVCRASSGVNAPEMGARLGGERGLTAECIKTRQAQRCEDALTDPRADAEASRSLGVRSVVILPLLREGGLAGLLELFSSRAKAFGERDELLLEALGQRVLKNLERARELLLSSSANMVAAQNPAVRRVESELENPRAGVASATTDLLKIDLLEKDEVNPEPVGRRPRSGVEIATLVLGAAVVACAVMLTTLVALRLGWRKTNAPREQVATSASKEAQTGTNVGSLPAAGNSTGAVNEKENGPAVPNKGGVRSSESSPPEGSLLVYENGKEVFRLPPANATGMSGMQSEDQNPGPVSPKNEETRRGHPVRASAVEPDGVVEVSPEAAEGILLQRVEPEYPEEARQQQMQGAVVLDVRIGHDGTVQDVKLVSGQRLLADAAIAAVKQWRFKPRLQRGQLVEMQTKITLYFRMPG